MTKLTLCLLALTLTLAFCDTVFRPSETPSENTSPENPHKAISEFFEAYFKHFDLKKPDQIIYECFTEKTAGIYFELLYGYGKILQDLKDRASWQIHLDFAKMYVIGLLEHTTGDCIVQTQDLSDLLDALGVKRDPFLANVGNYLYYQAHFAKMYDDFHQVLDHLNAKDYKSAGEAYAVQTKNTVDTIVGEGLYYLGHTGFANGFALGLDIDLPSDSLTVWNDTTAMYDLELMVDGARTVAEGKWWESYNNLERWWERKGKEIFEKIPGSVWECLEGSEDNKKITKKLGMNILTEEFGNAMLVYVQKHPLKYHCHAKMLVKAFDEFNLLHAGSLHAHLVKDVVKSKK